MSTSILPYIQNQMNFYGYPILLVIGNIGNLLILIIFNRQKHNACSIYLMNSAIANILYLTIGGFFRIYTFSYNDGTIRSLILCKISNFTPSFLGQVTKTLLIFACIDRFLITSNRASFRAFSTSKRAKYFTCFIYIFWAIIASHTLVWITINNGQCGLFGDYSIFFAFYAVLFIGLIPTTTLCIFASLTYKNMKQLRARIQPRGEEINNLKKRDHDLLVLVMAEVIIYIITTTPLTTIHFERMITQFAIPNKTLQIIQIELFVLNAGFLMIFVFSAVPFYTYFISSTAFRRDCKQLILTNYQRIRGRKPEQTISASIQTNPQRDTRV